MRSYSSAASLTLPELPEFEFQALLRGVMKCTHSRSDRYWQDELAYIMLRRAYLVSDAEYDLSMEVENPFTREAILTPRSPDLVIEEPDLESHKIEEIRQAVGICYERNGYVSCTLFSIGFSVQTSLYLPFYKIPWEIPESSERTVKIGKQYAITDQQFDDLLTAIHLAQL